MTGSERPAVVAVEDLRMHFPVASQQLRFWPGQRQMLRAVDGVSLTIHRGEVVGLIGESGSGKSTLGRTILRLYEPTGGTVAFQGRDVSRVRGESLRRLRRHMQMIFQNPFSAMNRRHRLLRIITDPMRVHGIGTEEMRRQRGLELLDLVGLPAGFAHRYPHEVSGGQLQRVGIARALSTEPDFLIADEPTASLDVSVRAQVMNLLMDLKRDLDLTLLFISHDLSVVSYLADRVSVMYLGRIVETAGKDRLLSNPSHPYTQALIKAVPRPDPRARRDHRAPLGEVPSAVSPPRGCHYRGRCPLAMPICAVEYPPLVDNGGGQFVACHAVSGA